MVRVLLGKEDDADLSYKSWLWVQNHCSEEIFVKSFTKVFEEDAL
jgi:DNA-binding SARP family transcriptional activator